MLLAPLLKIDFSLDVVGYLFSDQNGVVWTCALEKLSPILLAPGADFVEGNFSIDSRRGMYSG